MIKKILFINLFISFFTGRIYAQSPGIDIADFYGFRDIRTLGEGVQRLTGPTFAIATASVVIYFLVGGVKYLLSGGDKTQVEGAQKMITHAIVGFVILLFAYLVLQFIPQAFGIKLELF